MISEYMGSTGNSISVNDIHDINRGHWTHDCNCRRIHYSTVDTRHGD